MSVMPVAIHTFTPDGIGIIGAPELEHPRQKRSHRPQRHDDPTTVRDDNHHAALAGTAGTLGAVSATTMPARSRSVAPQDRAALDGMIVAI